MTRNIGDEQDKLKGHNSDLLMPKILPKDRMRMQLASKKSNKE